MKLIPVFILLFVLAAGQVVSADMAGMPFVQLPLGPPASIEPYDDDEFFLEVNDTIYRFCTGETLPVGDMNAAAYDALAGSYYSLIRMNVSHDRYDEAEEDIAFLSYTLTLIELYNDYKKEKEKFSPVDMGITEYDDVWQYYSAASGIWKKIASRYPDAEMYGMPPQIADKNWIIGQFPVV